MGYHYPGELGLAEKVVEEVDSKLEDIVVVEGLGMAAEGRIEVLRLDFQDLAVAVVHMDLHIVVDIVVEGMAVVDMVAVGTVAADYSSLDRENSTVAEVVY